MITFDRLGNMEMKVGPSPEVQGEAIYATYRVDGDSLIVTSPEDGEHVRTYRIEGDSLTFEWPEISQNFRRVPDDS